MTRMVCLARASTNQNSAPRTRAFITTSVRNCGPSFRLSPRKLTLASLGSGTGGCWVGDHHPVAGRGLGGSAAVAGRHHAGERGADVLGHYGVGAGRATDDERAVPVPVVGVLGRLTLPVAHGAREQ